MDRCCSAIVCCKRFHMYYSQQYAIVSLLFIFVFIYLFIY